MLRLIRIAAVLAAARPTLLFKAIVELECRGAAAKEKRLFASESQSTGRDLRRAVTVECLETFRDRARPGHGSLTQGPWAARDSGRGITGVGSG